MDSSDSSSMLMSLTIGERVCSVFLPLIVLVETIFFSLAGCLSDRCRRKDITYSFHDLLRLANDSPFTVNEVEALFELYKKLSSSIVNDGRIHKEELQLALLKRPAGGNFFLDRLHSSCMIWDKLGTLNRKKYVMLSKELVRQMVLAIFKEKATPLPREVLEAIMKKTFEDADSDMDGRIDKDEWEAFINQNPMLLNNMTIPSLKDVSTIFTSFIFNTQVDD